MAIDHAAYLKVRAQVLFLIDVVELLAESFGGNQRAARIADQASEMVRIVLETIEGAAYAYAGVNTRLNDVLERAHQMKAEGRAPTHVEWEALRSEIETASLELKQTTDAGGSSD